MTATTTLPDQLRAVRTVLVRHGVNGVPQADRMLGEVLDDLERPPGREDPTSKAHRYLADGRLEVVLVADDEIEATCTGDSGTYLLGWHGAWHCSCPARTDRCAHLLALRLVVTATTSTAAQSRLPAPAMNARSGDDDRDL